MNTRKKGKSSPWDPCHRITVNPDELNLDKPYNKRGIGTDNASSEAGPSSKNPKKTVDPKPNPRWEHTGMRPMTDPARLPDGWTTNEPDLDPYDIDGQIARCHERIQANIMPMIFRQRLKEYELVKSDERIMEALYPGMKGENVQRIMSLKEIYDHVDNLAGDEGKDPIRAYEGEEDYQSQDLEEITELYQPVLKNQLGEESEPPEENRVVTEEEPEYEDPRRQRRKRQLENIKAVIKAYEDGSLDWRQGFVTYWSKGKQLCQPRPFHWDEFEAIYDKYDGHNSFWTEGVWHLFSYIRLQYKLALRIPGYEWWDELEFLHDTGAGMMNIFRGDIRTLMGPFGPPRQRPPRVLWTTQFATGAGNVTREIIELEVTMLNNNRERIAPWTRIQVSLTNGDYRPGESLRPAGPWLRYIMYTATVPNERLDFCVADNKSSITQELPTVSHRSRLAPEYSWSARATPPGIYAPPTRPPPRNVPREAKARPRAAKGVDMPEI
ncbi:hypothetical protein N7492_004576, partial [Penicillium capsulatum]